MERKELVEDDFSYPREGIVLEGLGLLTMPSSMPTAEPKAASTALRSSNWL